MNGDKIQALPTADDPRWQADPLADATVDSFLGRRLGDDAGADDRAEGWRRLAAAQRALGQWTDNASLATWQPEPGCPDEVGHALRRYLDEARALPPWADATAIARAEALFMRHGPLSCLLLFCASLPECYVMPDLSAVLHEAGQLEAHTEHRIRQTAAMIFPVMLAGGLTDPRGAGVAQVLKVRLIHATIRHLILRGDPQAVVARSAAIEPRVAASDGGPALALHRRLHAMGWPLAERGLPCNQLELGYTLLTFHYVYLRGLRTLGVPLDADDERACLHAWNVMGHVLGLTGPGMAASMPQAQEAFDALRARAATQLPQPDPRPALAQALMAVMQAYLPWRWLHPLPVLMTRRLTGPATARALALDGPQPWPARLLFGAGWALVQGLDRVARLFWPRFTLSGLVVHVVGVRMLGRLLMDQTRPLRLPEGLAPQVHAALAHWRAHPGHDRAPARTGWATRLARRWMADPTRGS